MEDNHSDFKIRILSETKGEERKNDARSVAERILGKPTVVHIFTDFADLSFDPTLLKEYLQQTFGPNFSVQFEGTVKSSTKLTLDEMATKLVEAKTWAEYVENGWKVQTPIEDKIDVEMKMLAEAEGKSFKELSGQHATRVDSLRRRSYMVNNDYYEGSLLKNKYREILPSEYTDNSGDTRNITLVITGRGIGDAERGGIHVRAGIFGEGLGVISTTGLVEAPGKPQELEMQLERNRQTGDGLFVFKDPEIQRKFYQLMGKMPASEAAKMAFGDRILYPNDPRMTDALKGISLQATLFSLGEFSGNISQCSCSGSEPDMSHTCRLHDAHFQEELVNISRNVEGRPEFCQFHEELFTILKEG